MKYKPALCSIINSGTYIIPAKTIHMSKVVPCSVLMGNKTDVEARTVLRSKQRIVAKGKKFSSYLLT